MVSPRATEAAAASSLAQSDFAMPSFVTRLFVKAQRVTSVAPIVYETDALDGFPARSVPEALSVWVPMPSRYAGPLAVSQMLPATRPERASVIEQVTDTDSSIVYVVAPLKVMTGGVLSIDIPVTVAVTVPPPFVDAVRVTVWPAPSVVTTTSAGQETMMSSGSPVRQSKVTVTSVLFHPFAFALGAREASIVAAGRTSVATCGSWSLA